MKKINAMTGIINKLKASICCGHRKAKMIRTTAGQADRNIARRGTKQISRNIAAIVPMIKCMAASLVGLHFLSVRDSRWLRQAKTYKRV